MRVLPALVHGLAAASLPVALALSVPPVAFGEPAVPDRAAPQTAGRERPALATRTAPGVAVPASPAERAAPGRPGAPGVIDGALEEVLRTAEPDELVPVLLLLDGAVPRETIERLRSSGADRGALVARLRAASAGARRGLETSLAALLRAGHAARPRPVWIANALAVDARPAAVRALAALPVVARARHLPRRDAFAARRPRVRGPATSLAGLPAPGSVDWGTRRIGAERVTREIGITGRGVLVAVIDSGVCWRHPDIAARVHVRPGEDLDGDGVVMDDDDLNGLDDDGNGFVDDLVGWDVDDGDNDPDDTRSGHGSHVAGSLAGDGTSGYRAGVAPGASILPVRVGAFSSDEADAWRGIEYALESGADVINLSMGWRHVWGADRATWRRVVDAVTAAGVPFVVAAGNEGRAAPPGSVRSPGDVPSAITVGSTDVADVLADDSSIGPTTWEDVAPYRDFPLPGGLLKPDVVAPGVDVESHARCDGTALDSGTSMATPHVAGTIALLLEADPSLDPESLRAILQETAVDLGAPGPDMRHGHGRIDAFAAVDRANGRLRHAGHAVVDDATGNGTGAIDPGELAALSISLLNASGDETVHVTRATLVSETAGLAVERAGATYPPLPPGSARAPVGALPLVRSALGCGDEATLRLDVVLADGRTSRTRFSLRSGAPEPATLLVETFDGGSRDLPEGWTVEGNAVAGAWRAAAEDDPFARRGSRDNGPGMLVTGGAGDDVDGGETRLLSPAWDASRFTELTVRYDRRVAIDGASPALPDPDALLAGAPFDARAIAALTEAPVLFAVEASDDDGRSWLPVELVTRASGGWRRVTRPLRGLLAPGPTLRLRMRVVEEAPAEGEPDPFTRAAFDRLVIEGRELVCAPAP